MARKIAMRKFSKKIASFAMAIGLLLQPLLGINTVYADPVNEGIVKSKFYDDVSKQGFLPPWSTTVGGRAQLLNAWRFVSASGETVYCLDNGKKAPERVDLPAVEETQHSQDFHNVIENGYPSKRGADYGVTDLELEWATSVALYLALPEMYEETGELKNTTFTVDKFGTDPNALIYPTYSEKAYGGKGKLSNALGMFSFDDQIKPTLDGYVNGKNFPVEWRAGVDAFATYFETYPNKGLTAQQITEIRQDVEAIKQENDQGNATTQLETLTQKISGWLDTEYESRVNEKKLEAQKSLNLIESLKKDTRSLTKIDFDVVLAKTFMKDGKQFYGPFYLMPDKQSAPARVTLKLSENLVNDRGAEIVKLDGINYTPVNSLVNQDVSRTALFVRLNPHHANGISGSVILESDSIKNNLKYTGGGPDYAGAGTNPYQYMYIAGTRGSYKNKMDVQFNQVQRKGFLEIYKTDGDTGRAMSNVRFELFTNPGNVSAGVLTTNQAGYASLSDIPEGRYLLRETVPQGYNPMQDREVNFIDEMNQGQTVFRDRITLSIENTKPRHVVKIKKVNENNEPLQGAEFEVRNNENTVVSSGATIADGTFTTVALLPGSYTIRETKAPAGYEKITNEISFILNGDGSVVGDLTIRNVPKRNTVILVKRDKDTNDPLQGATFVVRDAKSQLVATLTTNTKGETDPMNLPFGNYTFTETVAPAGYQKTNEVFNFQILKDGTITGTRTVQNVKLKNKVVISKTDVTTAAPVEGAKIEIRDAKTGAFIASGVTDANGKTPEFNVSFGKYKFREILAPEGYVLSDKEFEFEVLRDGTIKGSTTFTNELAKHPISLTKIDAKTRVGLANAEFEVKDEKGNIVGLYKTGSNGKTEDIKLYPGKYTFKETVAPAGYIKIDKVFTFEIAKSGRITGDTIVLNDRDNVTLKKVDERGRALEGAKIEIEDDRGKVVYSGESDRNGEFKVEHVSPGRYTIRETKAPDGYVKLDKPLYFRIDDAGRVSGDTEIKNEKLIVEIIKKDRDSKETLRDAEIAVFDHRSKEIFSGRTNSRGILEVEGLAPGTYYYRETKAPDGYELNRETFRFTVEDNGDVRGDLTLYNSKIRTNTPPPSPNTPPSTTIPRVPITPYVPNVVQPNPPVTTNIEPYKPAPTPINTVPDKEPPKYTPVKTGDLSDQKGPDRSIFLIAGMALIGGLTLTKVIESNKKKIKK